MSATTHSLPHATPLLLLKDRYGRIARDLRVSLTDRCNLRCTYCMPAQGLDWTPSEQLLTDEEIIRLVTIGVQLLGIRQVRFTGGEPLLKKSLDQLIHKVKQLHTDEGKSVSTALTTNGIGLHRKATQLKDAGLDRVNISLDTLNPEHFSLLTRRDRFKDVIAGIEAAINADLSPVKINSVIMPGVNEDDILPLAEFGLYENVELRFIEQMPLGPRDQWDRSAMVTAQDIIDVISTKFDLTPDTTEETAHSAAPATMWRISDGDMHGKIGIIASVTRPFCGACDRTRLTSDGAVRSCLFSQTETSLRDLLRQGRSDNEIAEAWAAAMWLKPAGHGIDDPSFVQPHRPMSAIGG